jgi:hypothetical protein
VTKLHPDQFYLIPINKEQYNTSIYLSYSHLFSYIGSVAVLSVNEYV